LACILLSACFLSLNVRAVSLEDTLGLDSLTEELPEEASRYMSGLKPEELPGQGILDDLVTAALSSAEDELAAVTKTARLLLTVCVIVSLADALELGSAQIQCVFFAGIAAIGAAGMGDLDSFLRLGTESLHKAAEYAKVVLPVLSASAAAGGAAAGAAARYAATALFLSVLLDAADLVILPCISGLAALSLADAAIGNNVLKSAKKLLKRICELLLTGLCLGFTAWLTLTGAVSDPADAFAARAAKTAISTALPVVGGILSDAAGTLSAAAGVLRGSIGVFGILALAYICIGPLAALGVRYLAYKLAAVFCCCVSDKRLTKLVEDLGSCFGLILALNGAGAMMLFFSLYSLIRTAV
jgi:stage III sporulation protein AE